MRLLRLQEDGGFSLTRDLVDNIPPYAILSHTWGDDDQEVTFHNIQHHAGQHKQGYQKLKFCAEKAALDDLHYFWVDTCCIDKSSSAELTEAINSMFRWYRDAVRCYVYLSDVFKNDSENTEPPGISWETAFLESRWFGRGWTLQELIAPRSVTFYSSEGRYLGDKASLDTLVHEITGIPTSILQGAPLSNFSIHDRLSWLGTRQTKRVEDRAYSLLGIFDVHLPLIYGEGEKNAFIRLEDEIHKRFQNRNRIFIGKLVYFLPASFTYFWSLGNNFSSQKTQTSSLQIQQGRSSFQSNITLGGNASIIQGNKIIGVSQGDIKQEGSDFTGHIMADEKAQIAQGNQINGNTTYTE